MGSSFCKKSNYCTNLQLVYCGGVYQDRKLVQTFRYMEDGTFNTEDEEEYQLPKQGQIGLVHPIELSQELKDAWRQQLEDYEIVQPIDQLERNIYCVTEEEAKSKQLLRFGGYLINDLSLCGKLLDIGWYRGSTQEWGRFLYIYREDPEVGFGVELHFRVHMSAVSMMKLPYMTHGL